MEPFNAFYAYKNIPIQVFCRGVKIKWWSDGLQVLEQRFDIPFGVFQLHVHKPSDIMHPAPNPLASQFFVFVDVLQCGNFGVNPVACFGIAVGGLD